MLEDNVLHSKLQHGDMIAQDAMYHHNFLTKLYKKASVKQLVGKYTDDSSVF